MYRLLILSSMIAILLGGSSCTRRLTDFTIISTYNVPLGVEGTTLEKVPGKRVKGKDSAPIVLFIPFGEPNMKEAIDKAIQKTPGCIGLADGVVKSSWWTCLLFSKTSYIVEGTPLYAKSYTESHHSNDSQYGNYQQPYTPQQQTYTPQQQTYVPQQQTYNQQTTVYSQQVVSVPQKDEALRELKFHHVAKGETLQTIATRYGVTPSEIIEWNDLPQRTKVNAMLPEDTQLVIYVIVQ
ncbi:MAG: LysM peptidoglycan-binding domain-containing protein [Bacteroidales bacterium]|nr:LysM peptidoglycan-binding domain-containing protein [Bacteroidales bacterium]